MTGAFKATSLPALDIETSLDSISFKLDKLGSESHPRIVSSQLYETIINKRPKLARLKQHSPLENLTRQLEKRSGLSIANFEKTVSFIVSPWWVPPKTIIALNNSEAKETHDQIAHNLDPQNHLVVYTNGSRMNGKIRAAAVVPEPEIIFKPFFGPS